MNNRTGSKPSLRELAARNLQSGPVPATASPVIECCLNPDANLPWVVTRRQNLDLIRWATEHKPRLDALLSKHGAILFRGFGRLTPAEFEEFIRAVSAPAMEYRERSSPRTAVGGRIYTSTDYPPEYDILPHNENSYAHTWPLKIFFYCERPPVEGGETPLTDVRRVYARIPVHVRAKFERQGVMYMRNFGEALGLSWQVTFQTQDRAAVEQYCRSAGYDIAWTASGLRTRRVAPAVRLHPVTGEPLWFNHAAFFHVSTLHHDIRAALQAQFAQEDLPNHTYYGDGSPIEPEALAEIHAAYRSETIRFRWEEGDVLMVDNMLTAHARSAYRGERKILVGMSEPFDSRHVTG